MNTVGSEMPSFAKEATRRAANGHLVPLKQPKEKPPDRSGGFRYFHDRQAQFVLNLRTSMKFTAVPLKRAGSIEAVLTLKPSA